MADKVVILLLNVDMEVPDNLGAPFFQAAVAAAMDLEVEIHFAARTTRLLVKGFADRLYPAENREKSIYSFMQDAHEAGVKFYACAGAAATHQLTEDNSIPELDGIRGVAAFLGAAIEDDVLTLTY
jgi:uncharacterized protein